VTLFPIGQFFTRFPFLVFLSTEPEDLTALKRLRVRALNLNAMTLAYPEILVSATWQRSVRPFLDRSRLLRSFCYRAAEVVSRDPRKRFRKPAKHSPSLCACVRRGRPAEFYRDFAATLRKLGSSVASKGTETQVYRRRAGLVALDPRPLLPHARRYMSPSRVRLNRTATREVLVPGSFPCRYHLFIISQVRKSDRLVRCICRVGQATLKRITNVALGRFNP
jgi:hypothetical protein